MEAYVLYYAFYLNICLFDYFKGESETVITRNEMIVVERQYMELVVTEAFN